MRFWIAGLVSCGVVALGLGAFGGRPVQAGEDAAKPEYFTTKVKPILDANCGRCHEGTFHRGGLNMDTRESLLKGRALRAGNRCGRSGELIAGEVDSPRRAEGRPDGYAAEQAEAGGR